jgi:hypothetical protein
VWLECCVVRHIQLSNDFNALHQGVQEYVDHPNEEHDEYLNKRSS